MLAKFNEWMKELDTSNMTMENAPRCILTFAKKKNDDGTMSEDYYLYSISKHEVHDDKVLETYILVGKNGKTYDVRNYFFDKEQRVHYSENEKYVEADCDFIPKIKTVFEAIYGT